MLGEVKRVGEKGYPQAMMDHFDAKVEKFRDAISCVSSGVYAAEVAKSDKGLDAAEVQSSKAAVDAAIAAFEAEAGTFKKTVGQDLKMLAS